jgi:hypothetical protein
VKDPKGTSHSSFERLTPQREELGIAPKHKVTFKKYALNFSKILKIVKRCGLLRYGY